MTFPNSSGARANELLLLTAIVPPTAEVLTLMPPLKPLLLAPPSVSVPLQLLSGLIGPAPLRLPERVTLPAPVTVNVCPLVFSGPLRVSVSPALGTLNV